MSDTPSIGSIREQAAYWAVRLENDSVTELGGREFEAWILADPAHERAFLRQVAIGALAGEMVLRNRVEIVSRKSVPKIQPPPRRLRFTAIAAGVALVALAAAWVFMPWSVTARSYVTRTGEQRIVQLEDGSSVTLNTRSELRWMGSPRDRRVILKRGEALFDVVHDRRRPFRVLVDRVEIRVLGTQFDAYRREDGTLIVSVLEGTVDVSHRDDNGNAIWTRQLSASQQMQYGFSGSPVVRTADARRAVRWKQGELEIEDDPLPDVIGELARYTDQHIVLVGDPRLSRLHVGGVLSVTDIDSALALLEKREPIQVARNQEKGEYTLSYRAEPPSEPPRDTGARR